MSDWVIIGCVVLPSAVSMVVGWLIGRWQRDGSDDKERLRLAWAACQGLHRSEAALLKRLAIREAENARLRAVISGSGGTMGGGPGR